MTQKLLFSSIAVLTFSKMYSEIHIPFSEAFTRRYLLKNVFLKFLQNLPIFLRYFLLELSS